MIQKEMARLRRCDMGTCQCGPDPDGEGYPDYCTGATSPMWEEGGRKDHTWFRISVA